MLHTTSTLHPALALALGYHYPRPGSAEQLADAVHATHGVVQRHLQLFVDDVSALSLAEWEELHTATLDLSPKVITYVGHIMWGDNYRRGEFMADLKGAMRETGTALEGELPDHLEPILRYLAVAETPMKDLVDVLPGATTTMKKNLKAESPGNPYLHLLDATVAFVADLRPLTIGTRR